MSLKIKLTFAFLLASLTGIVLVALLAGVVTRREFGNFVDAQNRTLILERLTTIYEENGGWPAVGRGNPRPMQQGEFNGRFYFVADANGRVVIPGGGMRPNELVPPEVLRRGEAIMVEEEQIGTLLLMPQAGRGPALDEFSQRVNGILLIAALGATAVSLILGFFIIRSLTRPIQEITTATQKVAAGDLTQTVPVHSHDELGKLAASFNQMSSQLFRSREQRRQMTADIAHELRTPLSIILGHAEALSDGVLPATQETFDVFYDEAKRLDRMIADLRTLSLADAGELIITPRLVAPSDLLVRTAAAYAAHAQQKNIAIDMHPHADLPQVFVDPDRFAQVLDNLLGNALRLTPQNGRIQLSALPKNNYVELHIQDSGPGLSPAEAEHIFDRFYRADKSRQRQEEGGSGLGLAIAKSIVVAHNGRIHVESQPGQGATFIIELPLSASTHPDPNHIDNIDNQ